MRPNPARQKRTAESSARFASAKKPRFDYRNPSTLAPDTNDGDEADTILDLDEIGRSGQHTKRNAVNLDGFESDSSGDEERRRGKEGGNAGMDEEGGAGEEMDMFAGEEGDGVGTEEGRSAGKKGKEVRFLDVKDIEGQELGSRSGGHVSSELLRDGRGKGRAGDEVESSSESGDDVQRDMLDPEDDDAEELGAGSKKRHAPKLDAFNMKNEAEEGRFDESGNFVRKAADPDAVHDNWLEGLSKKDMKKAAEAREQREADRRRRDAEMDSVLTSELLATLIRHLERAETVLEALQRLGGGKKKPQKKVSKWKRKKASVSGGGDDMEVDVAKDEDPGEIRRREQVDAITGAADQLFSRDQPEIYDAERELLIRQYKRETGEDWVEPAEAIGNNLSLASQQWEYRWSDARDGGDSHGPYDGPTMQAWTQAGYFGEAVEFRRIGDATWNATVDFV
ncbi:LIN1-like protein [Sphaceloma murrayae]|uniref:LIN1-like protein n=1 Tax=Sphaceloma murrayae TaxID=2082308 RepID=A0A2K1QRA8_9PEZI|nr:LIN1-like protein [Sphaceloma murrayae]